MSIAIMWFRRDLRLYDNPAFAAACQHQQIIPLYIDDCDNTLILGSAQKWWLHHSLQALHNSLLKKNLKLLLKRGTAADIINGLVSEHQVSAIYWNRCYEPKAINRDTKLKSQLTAAGIDVKSFNGSLLCEPWTVSNGKGEFFKVFTPFWRQCLRQIQTPAPVIANDSQLLDLPSEDLADWKLLPTKPNWAKGFSAHWLPGEEGALQRLQQFCQDKLTHYHDDRDYPDKPATSKLSPHLHFGEISPWTIWREIEQIRTEPEYSLTAIDRFQAELGWREFSYHLLYHNPRLDQCNFRSEFDRFPWQTNENLCVAWQRGLTGYPIVDAGMRELWHTGWMHNRVRMIVASFLIKDLFIDWRIGASWFTDTLVDADLASNSASWQWVAGSGADAAPYFRIFNPILQGEKFDPRGDYIKTWIPELKSCPQQWIHRPWEAPNQQFAGDYPRPVVDHQEARQRALSFYQQIKTS